MRLRLLATVTTPVSSNGDDYKLNDELRNQTTKRAA